MSSQNDSNTQYAIPRQPAAYSTSQHCSHAQPQGRKGHDKRCRQGTAIRGPRICTARYGKRGGPQIKRVAPNRRGCSKIGPSSLAEGDTAQIRRSNNCSETPHNTPENDTLTRGVPPGVGSRAIRSTQGDTIHANGGTRGSNDTR